MKDNLGDRMKDYYEDRAKTYLPRRSYTIMRLDGKAFHTYTKGLTKPFDEQLNLDMDETAKFLCETIQGAKLAFVQSDEISILITDFDKLTTSAWFDYNVQKMVSVSAGYASAKFNRLRPDDKLAVFDSRVFTLPSRAEVANYFEWRRQDTTRNSISSLAQSMFSPKELKGKNTTKMKEMCLAAGTDWEELSQELKYGRLIIKEEYTVTDYPSLDRPEYPNGSKGNKTRTRWTMKPGWSFPMFWAPLHSRIPKQDEIWDGINVIDSDDSSSLNETGYLSEEIAKYKDIPVVFVDKVFKDDK